MPTALRTALSALTVLVLSEATQASRALAATQPLHDQSDLDTDRAVGISSQVLATQIDAGSGTRLDSVTIWLNDENTNDNGVIDSFSGTISWAIYFDDNGIDSLLYSGKDSSVEMVDTGLDFAGDIVRARIDLDGRPNVGGTVWIAFHEGSWGSVFDGTHAYMIGATTLLGLPSYDSNDLADPGPWTANTFDMAVVVEGDPLFVYQAQPSTSTSFGITANVMADDFSLAGTTTLGSADVWLSDIEANDNGIVDLFGGTLSWAIYPDDGGKPGAAPIATGSDASPVQLDQGFQSVGGADIVRVRIELAGRPVLAAGTYWFAIHEGAWLAPSDDTHIQWRKSAIETGAFAHYSTDPTAPGNWTSSAMHFAFILFEDELFASGFEAGVACAWSGVSGGTLCP